MRNLILLLLVMGALSSACAGEVIQKPGSYASPSGATLLRISDSKIPKAVFSHVHPDGRQTSIDISLAREGEWACLLQPEWTLWVFRKEDDFVREVTFFPPQDGEQFRTSTRRISIKSESDEIPAELRDVMK